tara:strand:- start:24227 stop:25603 length:1377 start_codon:yes stop_codon:yes gene_type:complete
MRAQGSIGRRLTLLLAAIAALLSVLSWGMVTGFARQAAERTQDNVLAASATSIADTLRTEQGRVRLELPYAAFSMLGAISQERVFYKVTANGDLLTGYADLPAPATPARRTGGAAVFQTESYRGSDVRLASVTRLVLVGADPVAVSVTMAQTRDGVAQIAGELSTLAALLSIAFFLVAVILSAVAVRASLAPLNDVALAVSRRGPSDLRPVRRAAPAELEPLLRALNHLMDRLGQSIRRSEDFITEAAHRVRTPLATVRAQAEIALRSVSDEDEKHRLRRIIRAVDESSRSAGQLLDHATVAYRTEQLAQDRLDLAELATASVDSLKPTAAMKDILFTVRTDPAQVLGDPVLLDSALRNVLDNAVKYSPAETDILVTVGATNGSARIEVRDHGPGFGDGPAQHLTRRFRRGDNTGAIVGSGLGLTIAKEVLGAHHGTLELGNAQDGRGACVSLVLPLA